MIILFYILALILQFFSPWWVQLIMMSANYMTPDFIPFADEIAQAIIFSNKVKSMYTKAKIANKVYNTGKAVYDTGKTVYNQKDNVYRIIKNIIAGIFKIVAFILIVGIGIIYTLNKENNISNNVQKEIFHRNDVSKIDVNTKKIEEYGIDKNWIFQHSMYDNVNKKIEWNDLQILELTEKIVLEKNREDFLQGFTKEELGILRNSIFAKRGFGFKKGGKYRTYFENKSWYIPKIESQDEIELSELEKKFITIIKKYEEKF